MGLPDIVATYSQENRVRGLTIGAMLIALIALSDWKISPNVSLGFLYVVPFVLAAGFLTNWQVVGLALLCSVLRETFGPPPYDAEGPARFVLSMVVFLGLGLYVTGLVRNRQLAVQHLREIQEQVELRKEAEEQLRVLVETSPAAIMTLDSQGRVLMANESAHRLLGFDQETLSGQHIEPFLPILASIPQLDRSSQIFRTMVEERGHRRDGDVFLAHVWFSTYRTASGPRLAAIILDASEHLRDREDVTLESLMKTSRILVGAVSHELRNLCGAATVAYANLTRRRDLPQSEDLQALGTLIGGLQKIASMELRLSSDSVATAVDLQLVFDDLRIVIEPLFRDSDAEIRWGIAPGLPRVRADHHGLLQVFLNLAHNSLRAMQDSAQKLLTVTAEARESRVVIRFRDTGKGIAAPERLFQPFQLGSDASGLGLYVSRVLVRSFAGELSNEPQAAGSCFAIDLMAAQVEGE